MDFTLCRALARACCCSSPQGRARRRRPPPRAATCGWSACTTSRRARPTSPGPPAGERWIATSVITVGRKPNHSPAVTSRTGRRSWTSRTRAAPVPQPHPRRPGRPRRAAPRWCASATAKRLPKGDPAKTYLLRTLGNLAHEIWDVTGSAPAGAPDHGGPGLNGTHKNWWSATPASLLRLDGASAGLAHEPDDQDLRSRRSPSARFIRDFGLPGQEPGLCRAGAARGSTADPPSGTRLHSPTAPERRASPDFVGSHRLLAGNPAGPDPLAPTRENLLYPQIGRLDMAPDLGPWHTSFPVLGVPVADFAQCARRDARLRGAGLEC